MNQWRIVEDHPAPGAFTLERLAKTGEYVAYDERSLPEKPRQLIMQFLLSREAWIDRREGAHFFYYVLG